MIPELSEVNVPDQLRADIESYMAKYPDRHSAVIPALRAAQDHYGWCSPEALEAVAAVMRVTPAYLESIASFYDMLYLKPTGRKKIMVCTNLSCMMRGAKGVLREFERATGAKVGGSSPDGIFQLESFECLGACGMAPMASIDGHYRGPLTPDNVEKTVEQLKRGETPFPEKKSPGDRGQKEPS